MAVFMSLAVPDPDLEIKGGGGGGQVGTVSKKTFSALWASVWSKNKREDLPWIRH